MTGARAGEYVTRNVHEYPATALLIAGRGRIRPGLPAPRRRLPVARFHNRYDQGPIDRLDIGAAGSGAADE